MRAPGWVIGIVVPVSAALIHYVRTKLWGEKPSKAPVKTATATVIAKEVKQGTQGSGRSNGGFSYAVTFQTSDGNILELYAYEIEFGGLKEGMCGTLTYQYPYFIQFEQT